MTFITDFADQAVILPVVLAIGIGMLLQGWRRGAVAWGLAVAATFGGMLVLKLLFLACPASLGVLDLRTPSGHVAAATVVSGGLAALLLRRRRLGLLVAAAAAVVIGATRLALGVHSPAEVAVGAAIGLAGAWALMVLAGRPPPGLDARRIVIPALVVALVLHGVHLPAEAHIRDAASRFAQAFGVCQSVEPRM
ncbi:MAG: phosphatase PAP2 family protein [Acetobacteraceae bacterium]